MSLVVTATTASYATVVGSMNPQDIYLHKHERNVPDCTMEVAAAKRAQMQEAYNIHTFKRDRSLKIAINEFLESKGTAILIKKKAVV